MILQGVQDLAVDRRPAAPRDRTFLRDLFADSRDDLLVLPPDTRDLIVDMRLRARRRRQDLDHPTARRDILVVDGRDIGQLVVDADQTVVTVLDLVVHSGWRRRGVGTAVLAAVVDDAAVTGRVVLTLERPTHPAGRRLVDRFGVGVAGSGTR